MATACYNLVAIAIAVVAAGQRERGREQEVLNAVLISGACGFALYFVCPVVGPVVSFGPSIRTRCRPCLSIRRC